MRDHVTAAVLVAITAALVSCGGPAGPKDQGNVRRVRFEEDKVTCYVVYSGISCVRDAP